MESCFQIHLPMGERPAARSWSKTFDISRIGKDVSGLCHEFRRDFSFSQDIKCLFYRHQVLSHCLLGKNQQEDNEYLCSPSKGQDVNKRTTWGGGGYGEM